MKLLFALLLAVANPAPDSGSVSSANASYDGNALVLKGQVMLDHGLGKMQAEEALLQRQENGKDFPFSLIHLQNDVRLGLHNNAELKCDTAELDFVTLKGTLRSSDKVSYTDSFKKKRGASLALRLLSAAIDLQFIKKGEAEKKTLFDIDTLTSTGGVQIDYANAFTLHADHATYHKSLLDPSKVEFQANISAYPKEHEQCHLTHEKDTIDASACHLDLVHSKISMLQPKGVLYTLFAAGNSDQLLHFSSDALLWDHLKNTLTLKGNIQLQEPSLGNILSQDELQLVQKKGELISLKTKGKTSLQYLNSHKLLCFGALSIDKEKLHATADSPLVQNAVPEGQQIYYEEGEVGLFADKAQMEYSAQDNSFQPVSISLKGNVRIFSHGPSRPARYGIADRVTYLLTTRTFILGADPGKKVLFVNNEDNLQISAQEVHITEDPTTKKQSVKGIGNVQLSLTADEQELLQKLFKALP